MCATIRNRLCGLSAALNTPPVDHIMYLINSIIPGSPYRYSWLLYPGQQRFDGGYSIFCQNAETFFFRQPLHQRFSLDVGYDIPAPGCLACRM